MMTAELWRRVEELYFAALEVEPESRRAFLERWCAAESNQDGVDLVGEVEALLAADGVARDLGDLPGVRLTLEDAGGEPGAGTRRKLGPYSIARELGRGGMGRVFLAVRSDDEFERRVAIKVLGIGGGTLDSARRFLLERQILADLDHPYIAKLFDGGTSEEGVPYLVMELVEGTRIDEYCDLRGAGVAERIVIFQKVCDAVAFAHKNLIVHRDIKPNNILITEAGEPKLLDFGIAKLIDAAAGEETTVGSPGPMTPSYASPEQRCGQTITTASDVYSLGAVLYKLLAGRTPPGMPDRSGGSSGSGAGPIRPSAVIADEEDDSGDLARRRSLRGDLDAIVLKALREEPELRYPSVESLSEDLRRHQEGLPVQAREDSLGYRLKKFVRRHRLGVAAASLSILFVLAVAAVMSVMAARIARERDRVRAERDKAQKVADFLVGVYETADPMTGAGANASAKEILDRSAGAIQEGMTEQPEVRAALLDAMGRVYFNLGLYDEADPLLADALRIRREVLGDENPETAASLSHRASLLREQGAFEEAERVQREALRILRSTLGADHPEVVAGLGNLGWLRIRQGDPGEAETVFRQAMESARHRFPESDPVMIEVHRNLANVLRNRNQLEEAEVHFRRAVALGESSNPEHPNLLAAKKGLALLLEDKGELEEAEKLYVDVLSKERRIFGPEHPRIAFTLSYLSNLRRLQGDYERAAALLGEALGIRKRSLGERHPGVAVSLVALANLAHSRGDLGTAERRYIEALEIARPNPPDGSLGLSYLVGGLGRVLFDSGRLPEAEPLLREALELRIETFRENHPVIDESRVSLAKALIALGRFEPAEELLREADAARSARGDTSEIGLAAAFDLLERKRG